MVPERPLEFTDEFYHQNSSLALSQKHLYAVLIYTRGNIEHEDACFCCADPEKKVFPRCVSLKLMAQGACAADVWVDNPTTCKHRNYIPPFQKDLLRANV